MPTTHSRKSSGGGLLQQQKHQKHRQPHAHHAHQRTHTAPDAPTLQRTPSTSSTAAAAAATAVLSTTTTTASSSRSRRATNPSTPTAPFAPQPSPSAAAAAVSPSYFAPQQSAPAPAPAPAGQDPRSPGTRRPPASHSGHGIDNSRGPPVTLVTRGNSDIVRRSSSHKAADFAFAQQQFVQSGLVSPAGSLPSTRRRRDDSVDLREAPQPQQQTNNRPAHPRRDSTSSSRPARHMTSSVDDSSEYESGPRSHHGAADNSGTDGEHTEDLFMNIAADSAPKQRPADSTARIDRLKSRIARVNNRQSLPSALHSPSPVHSTSTTPTTTRIAPHADSRSAGQRRVSHLPTSSRNLYDQSPQPPALTTPRTRGPPELSSKPSFSRKDAELSPRDFLAQFSRRPSQPDTLHTPPQRTGTYRPSNLNYSSSRDDTRTPHIEAVYEIASRADGTESHGSTGPATSVWDELDELKTRIRKIELGGKIPATAGAVISQASADRPRTANTSATTVSSSPNQQRKSNASPSESTVETHTPSNSRIQPLLRDALAKARQHISPSVYRALEATASEALTLAEMSGSAGPQGTLHSASSILGGTIVSDRQVRRKADNICRSLTELCIAMCDTKTGMSSPALRLSAAPVSRRPSVQINGESPTVRQSIEPESNTLSSVSPSRALSRIEARRTSMLAAGQRESSQEPFDDRHTPSRLQRAGTSLHRTRESVNDDDDDPILRAPSRAMTDFRSVRSAEKNRFSSSRQYTSREPLPELQPSPALQTTSGLRRPTISGIPNENSLLFRDGQRRYDLNREASPAYEKQISGNLRARAQLGAARNPNRNSIGGISELGRSVSLGRRRRGGSTGE
ncbi:hypothetical protein BKA66DRAFT_516262 [Pyrenochaeta sp. MPI-SDFR-AT-0127]|nr:hypothetical protein BKA66DRAFT_516262 [Pyrenochaeta sp. MPI-SDFR-AT-0127]